MDAHIHTYIGENGSLEWKEIERREWKRIECCICKGKKLGKRKSIVKWQFV